MEYLPLNLDLTFCDRATSSCLLAKVINISLIAQDDTPQDCRLNLQVCSDGYRQIETQALFNLKPEVRCPLSNGEFDPDTDVQLEISLHPELLPDLMAKLPTAEAIANYLTQLQPSSTSLPELHFENLDPLLQTENWFALSVHQIQANKETGYRTFWSYANLALLNTADTTDGLASEYLSEQLSQGIVNFFKDQIASDVVEAAQELGNELIQGISEVFSDLGQSLAADWDAARDESEDDHDQSDAAIQSALIQFLDEEDWSYVQLEPQSVLQLAIEGSHGRWNCQAHIRAAQQQLIFYSFCPVNAPIDRRISLAEFITRVNYTLAIGNFEMDFDDGEIRYRTSIDVDGDLLSSALIRQLVYANIMTLDSYLPGLVAVIQGSDPKDTVAGFA